ncbi:MAG TPA: ATP-binding protein [Kofleriaceae bacterium]
MLLLRPQLHGMTRRVVLNYLAIDLLFEGEIGLGFSYVVGLSTTADSVRFAIELAATAACMLTLFLVGLAVLLRPVERWIAADAAGRATRTEIERAGRALRRLPMQVTVLQMIKWPGVYAIVGVIHGGVPSQAALWLFVVTFLFGPPPIGHSMAVALATPALTRHSLAAHAAGIPDVARRRTLRTKLALYSICLCMAPAFYMSSMVVVAKTSAVTSTGLAIIVICFLTAVVIFAAVCAGLLATTITTPIRAIADVVQSVANSGYVGDARRIATLRHDEVGDLSELTNDMIAALARTEQARREASAAVAELNRTLELRVAERTSSLVEANAALAEEMRMRAAMECELRQAQKLESVGRLAAGIAHEINTPLQFVGDSVQFARECVGELDGLIAGYREMRRSILDGGLDGSPARELASAIGETEDRVDLPYLLEQLPPALDLALDGVRRVGSIVRSVKQFAYPDRAAKALADINLAIESTVTVSVSEYKDVADVVTELGEIPKVICHVGEINQVVLNLIVNAAHAIGDVVRGTGARGRITIRTWAEADQVVIGVADTGTGIPDAVRPHIFDAFYTTKEVGRGSGQGLAIARSVIVEKHGGRLTFDSQIGAGSQFYIRLPIAGQDAGDSPASLAASVAPAGRDAQPLLARSA